MTQDTQLSTTIGMDVGDAKTHLCVMDAQKRILEERAIRTSRSTLRREFEDRSPSRVALEVGAHSRWMSALLTELGHTVQVVDPRRLDVIARSVSKTDRKDARVLATLAVGVPEMLGTVRHRGEQAYVDRALLKSRDLLVRLRTTQIQHVRSVLKTKGILVPSISTPAFHTKVQALVPDDLRPALEPVLAVLEAMHQRIRELDAKLEEAAARYPAVARLQQIHGVGPVTSLGFVLTIDDPTRFPRSRDVGAWLGLCPRKRASGEQDPQLSITKAGDPYLRRLLVSAAQYILGPFGKDSDLRRYGERIHRKGGRHPKKRAVVAVARKLAVVLHRLWVSGEDYRALRDQPQAATTA